MGDTTDNEQKGPNVVTKKSKKSKTSKAKKNGASKARPVLVTTEHRGVFFGYADSTDGDVIVLDRARLCLYWSRDVRGFMGLAATGPSDACRVGPPAKIELRKITAIAEVTPEAVARWEAAPWAR